MSWETMKRPYSAKGRTREYSQLKYPGRNFSAMLRRNICI